MSAKQELANLFVRIPRHLKIKLARSASARGSPLAREVERLLGEQPATPLEGANLRLRLVEGQLRQLEQLILSSPDLKGLRKHVKELQRLRAEKSEETARVLEERARQPRVKEDLPNGMFGSLVKQVRGNMPVQLPVHERRRIRLLATIKQHPRGTKASLANALERPPSMVSQFLSGYRPINAEVARKVERFFGMPADELDRVEIRRDIAAVQVAAEDLSQVFREIRRSHSRKRQ